MPCFDQTRLDLVEFSDVVREDLPLPIDDMTLAFWLGIRNKTLWWLIGTKKQQYVRFSIPKYDHRGHLLKHRVIHNPGKVLKRVQRIILSRFEAAMPKGDHVGAYVPGRSCSFTAAQHTDKRILVSADLHDFFPSIRRAMVRRALHHLGFNHCVSSLLADLVTCAHTPARGPYAGRTRHFVPQGAPTSSLVANLVADERLDRPVLALLSEKYPGWCYTRYSDDIDLSHPSWQPPATVQALIDDLYRLIREAGFFVNRKKTRFEPSSRRQKVLGMVVNRKLSVPRIEHKRVKAILMNCLHHGIDTQYERAGKASREELLGWLSGKLNYYKQVDPRKGDYLQRLYDEMLCANAETIRKEDLGGVTPPHIQQTEVTFGFEVDGYATDLMDSVQRAKP